MNYGYYLFDLDNCLLNIPNPSEYFDKVLVETIKKLTLNHLPERKERNKFWFAGEKYVDFLNKWGIGNINDFWTKFDETDYEFRKDLLDKKELNLYEDVIEVLNKLKSKGKKLAIISNAANYIVEFIVNQFDIDHYFDETFGLGYGKDQAIAKPSPGGILNVLQNMNFNPNNNKALMVGDSRLDIYAAKRANIFACLIKREPTKYPDGCKDWDYKPDFTINYLDEILNI